MQELISTVIRIRNGAKIESTNWARTIDTGALSKEHWSLVIVVTNIVVVATRQQ